ncbi:DUF6950 family protein [Croceibacterium aestuarii]|uniref:DUF6950 family protein n=1 Tax=Croceibacterium aestuarii TaxID=3064139 RepID=UPI00272DFD20|nr:hypothetical protein [Croceibacterium sp. D39]
MDLVDETLREWRSGALVYGQSDCMLSIGRYLARAGHKDVTGLFVGRYDTREGALAMMAEHGGVPGLVAMTGAVPKCGAPARGDVLEVLYQDEDGVTGIGGICTGDAVALRLERGTIEVALRFVRYAGVWHVGD